MKKVMVVMVALMFAFSMALTGLALADSAAEKAKAPMSENAKDGQKVSSDAKAKDPGKSHEAKMDKKEKKSKKGKKGKKSKKSKKRS